MVGGSLRVLSASFNNKTDLHDIAEIFLKVALNTINQYIFMECESVGLPNGTSLILLVLHVLYFHTNIKILRKDKA